MSAGEDARTTAGLETGGTVRRPLYPIAVTLIYYDQRIRLEGYDIERMMQNAGLIVPSPLQEGERSSAPVEAGEVRA